MIDPRLLRAEPDLFRDSQLRRGADNSAVDRFLELDRSRRTAQQLFEEVRAQQKQMGKRIGPARGAEKRGELTEEQRSELAEWLTEAEELSNRVKAAESEVADLEPQVEAAATEIDNLVDPDAPIGSESDFRTLHEVGTPRDFDSEGFLPKDHLELGEILHAIDTDRAAKVSGSRFFYLTGDGALLELALLNLAMNFATGNGFTPIIPPALVRPPAMAGTGFLGQAEENVYRLEADDLYLVGTAEVPLAAFHSNEILDAEQLPLRYAGFSPCFRREAGSHGRDTRGIIRVHQFDKVEMFSFCNPDEAVAEHARLLSWEQEFLDLLELPYRVIDVATGDLGSSAARKYDIEAWIPTQGRYREVTSTSNCTTFQSRRLNIRMRSKSGAPHPLATLNGTLIAMPRVIVALLENHQSADGSVAIPEALRPYLGGRDRLLPK